MNKLLQGILEIPGSMNKLLQGILENPGSVNEILQRHTMCASSSSLVSSLKLTISVFSMVRDWMCFSLDKPLPWRLSTVMSLRLAALADFSISSSVRVINLKNNK